MAPSSTSNAGQHLDPRASTLRRLASVLGVPITDLFEALDDTPAAGSGRRARKSMVKVLALLTAHPKQSLPSHLLVAHAVRWKRSPLQTAALMTPRATTNDRMVEAVRA